MEVFKDKCLELIKTYETAQTSKVINREKYDRLVKAILSPRKGVETAHGAQTARNMNKYC